MKHFPHKKKSDKDYMFENNKSKDNNSLTEINQKEELTPINPNIITNAILEYFSNEINNSELIEKTGTFTQKGKY